MVSSKNKTKERDATKASLSFSISNTTNAYFSLKTGYFVSKILQKHNYPPFLIVFYP
jgi:hypothetical protein